MTSMVSTPGISIHNKKPVESIKEAAAAVVPDSTTTIERQDFVTGQDVLVKHKDGRYYLGTVVEVDNIRDQCLVKFGDNTESWSGIKDLTKLNTTEQEDLLCVICKQSAPKDKHIITVCNTCGRGYHQRCHRPEIPENQKEGTTWMCRRCLDSDPRRYKKSTAYKQLKRDTIRRICSGVNNPYSTPPPKALPYNNNMLKWDDYHRVNKEQVYCYCGLNGEWYTQMLQCSRCRQWFHEKCVGCLRYPLYCGDRFYVFVCAICNGGKEFLRRLEIKWVDLVHLMLFNLTAYNAKKYYDLDTVIIPYINDNWHALQLPPKILNISKPVRRDNILSILTNNRNRFKCGREIKKRATIWGLRVRLPPPAPCVILPPTGPVHEAGLREKWPGQRKLHFLPVIKIDPRVDECSSSRMIVPLNHHMLNIMMGTAYQNCNLSETESPCPSPEADIEAQFNDKLFNSEYHGGGCVKKSAPFPKISLQHRKRLLSLSNRDREKILRRQKKKNSKSAQSKRKKDIGARYCSKRLSVDSKINKSSETLPLTPPTSVSAPPTPPASGVSALGQEQAPDFSDQALVENLNELTKGLSSKLTKSNLSRNNLSVGLESHSLELNTPCDTSGDETSSKSTLDLIIPPPKDFKGKNNPFLALLRGSGEEQNKKRRSKDAITLPLPLTAVIPSRPILKPKKRQLSEKDIFIGPNGEVKRRRLRRSRQLTTTYNAAQPTASKTATVVPARPDGNEWSQRNLRSNFNQTSPSGSQIGNCVDYALNGRRLRHRQDKSLEKDKISDPPTPKMSPVKQEPDISMDELKSSVNIYFGAANRIAAGERFSVRAKRIGPTGNIQYLIEWEGPSNGMT